MQDNTSKYIVQSVDPAYLKGRRVLLLAPEFFGICRQLTSAIERLGASVDYYDTRPDNSFATKALIRVNRRLLTNKINRYYDKILELIRHNDYGYILIIKGEGTPPAFIKALKKSQPNAKLILYHWDAISLYTNHFNEIKGFFDRIVSFDPYDCRQYGMKFLPLFFDKPYEAISKAAAEIRYDAMFVGTVHTDRFHFISCAKRQLDSYGCTSFFYPFMPHKLMYLYQKHIKGSIRDVDGLDIKFTPLPQSALLGLYAQSHVVLDLNRSAQKGLTLRTLETLGAQRKLVTTNADIANYDFYDPQNILIVDRETPEIPEDFVKSPFRATPSRIYQKYGIDNWVANIFSL